MSCFAFLAVALGWSAAVLAVDNVTEPISTFVSRPDLQAPALHVSLQNSDPVNGFAPGYMFICPFQTVQHGPYIYDKFGNLVWSGYNASLGTQNSHDMKPCTYQGAQHLCLWQGYQRQGYGLGRGVIMDNTYTPVKYVNTGDGAPEADIHEFRLINGGESALLLAYRSFQYDLSAYRVMSQPSMLMEGMFQEVDVASGDVIFTWHSLDHVPLEASYVLPGTTDVSGNGSVAAPWDYFHINSVDKSSATNNYLISVRHTSAIYLIDSTDGHIIWELSCGGASASFTVHGFNFSFQHDARFMLENDTHTIISLFDDGSNGRNRTASESSGMIISLDLNAKTATLLSQTFAPIPGGILSDSQGNMQVFANGGNFHGWGSVAAVSENNAAGEPVLFASYGKYPVMNYRAYSYEWQGFPTDLPTIVAIAANVSNPVNIWVSWNGATEVRTWRFYGSVTQTGPFAVMGNASKTGFETNFVSPMYYPYIFVEALDADGKSLANSSVIGVKTPGGEGIVAPTPSPSVSMTVPATSTDTNTASLTWNATFTMMNSTTTSIGSSTATLATTTTPTGNAPSTTSTAAVATATGVAAMVEATSSSTTLALFIAIAVILVAF